MRSCSEPGAGARGEGRGMDEGDDAVAFESDDADGGENGEAVEALELELDEAGLTRAGTQPPCLRTGSVHSTDHPPG